MLENVIDIVFGGYDNGDMPDIQQYDANSHVIVCRLWVFEKGNPYVLDSDADVTVAYKRRQAEPWEDGEVEIVDQSTVKVMLPAKATMLDGRVEMQLVIRKDGEELRGPVIEFQTFKSLKAADDINDEPALLLVTLVNDANNAILECEAATKSIEDMEVEAIEAEQASAKLETVNGIKVLKLALVRGPKGDPGEPGAKGAPGYTPERGADYWTQADKAEIVSEVMNALPVYTGEVADACVKSP